MTDAGEYLFILLPTPSCLHLDSHCTLHTIE